MKSTKQDRVQSNGTRKATNEKDLVRSDSIFFPRVRTPCGHGAQVIVEGREERQMVEKGTKTLP